MSGSGAQAPTGFLLIDKPAGMTSHDVIAVCRKIFHTRKIGHAGTLDPMATGLLVLGVGAGTKLLQYCQGLDKSYTARIRFGQSTSTEDAEGEILTRADARGLTETQVDAALAQFQGPILQRPSSVSAIKVGGQRAYARVRAGEQVELKPRPIQIHQLTRTSELAIPADEPTVVEATVTVRCSSGTYIRALARDVGDALGVGAHLVQLRRTHVGTCSLEQSQPLPEMGTDTTLELHSLLELAQTLFPTVSIGAELAQRLRHGQRLALPAITVPEEIPDEQLVAVQTEPADLVAILKRENERWQPVTVFAQEHHEHE